MAGEHSITQAIMHASIEAAKAALMVERQITQ